MMLRLGLLAMIAALLSGGAVAQSDDPQKVTLSQVLSEGLLTTKVEPAYPPLARQARVQGTVVLHALIGKDGTIQELTVISGHPMLMQAAMDAVKQWRYKPYVVDGEPVLVQTTINIKFQLSAPASQPQLPAPPANSAHPERGDSNSAQQQPSGQTAASDRPSVVATVGGSTSAPKVTYDPDPQYSDVARHAGYQANVILSLVVDGTGQPTRIRVQQPVGMGLDEEAIAAVKTWRFEPAIRDGQPVSVRTIVEVNFHLDKPAGGPPLLAPRQGSAASQFPSADTSKYPLTVNITEAIGAPAGKGYEIAAKGSLAGSAPPLQVSLVCASSQKRCSSLGSGHYPARWLDVNHKLEILGWNWPGKKWEKTEYAVSASSPATTP